MSERGRRIEVLGKLRPDHLSEVAGVVDAATEHDGVRPLAEHVMLHLRYGGEAPARNILLYVGDELAGYAHLDPTDPVEGPSAELTVAPEYRERGHGRALTEALIGESPDGPLRLWAHGNHPAAGRLAASMGFVRIRALWQMRRSLYAALPPTEVPEGVTIRTFVVNEDEQAWVELNALAFADHPEQGAWTVRDLRTREREPWFDPDGFFLAERSGRLVAFHWTKVHGGDGTDHGHGHEPIGEVYVVGVDPAEQGHGLGRAITLIGLCHLRSLGLSQAMLYVEEANKAAIRLYESLGFTHWDTDVMFRRGPVPR